MFWTEDGIMSPSEGDLATLLAEVEAYLEAGDYDSEDRWNF